MKVRWSREALEFIEALEDYSSGLGLRVFQETEHKLRRFAGLHVIVPILVAEGAVRNVHRMVLSTRLPYKVYKRRGKARPLEGVGNESIMPPGRFLPARKESGGQWHNMV